LSSASSRVPATAAVAAADVVVGVASFSLHFGWHANPNAPLSDLAVSGSRYLRLIMESTELSLPLFLLPSSFLLLAAEAEAEAEAEAPAPPPSSAMRPWYSVLRSSLRRDATSTLRRDALPSGEGRRNDDAPAPTGLSPVPVPALAPVPVAPAPVGDGGRYTIDRNAETSMPSKVAASIVVTTPDEGGDDDDFAAAAAVVVAAPRPPPKISSLFLPFDPPTPDEEAPPIMPPLRYLRCRLRTSSSLSVTSVPDRW
jgi:hypothetical protein